MFKKIFLGLFLFCIFNLLLTKSVLAESEFSTDYNVTYDVDTSGETTVTEQIALKNLTDRYYASSFGLTIGATKISGVEAFDNGGPLDSSVEGQSNKTKINVKFNSQVSGKDKVYSWTLKFKSKDFASAQGKVWEVSVPKISSSDGLNNYNLTLSVPVEFGDPSSILPEPKNISESGGKINLSFTKDQLTETGILANFGTSQLLGYNLVYHIKNRSALSSVAKLPLPPDTNYQQISIQNINPKPENVTIDANGNYIAWFKIDRNKTMSISVSGLAKLFLNSQTRIPQMLTNQEKSLYTSAQKYWETNNPLIEAKVADILKDSSKAPVKEKARLINKFVVATLKYSGEKLSKGDFNRLGALTALNNPDSALCSEFTDLFIALARSAGIPAREADGYAYTPNSDIRPLSFNGTILHAWPEYFDPESGWVMIDPTWQNTTGGVDYFSKFDLNHLVLAIRGSSSTEPQTADQVQVEFSNAQFNPYSDLKIELKAPSQIYAGFPAGGTINIVNAGTAISPSSLLSIQSGQLNLTGQNPISTPSIPPLGKVSYNFNLRTKNLWQSLDEELVASISGQTSSQKVTVRPFFAFKFFPVLIFAFIGLMVLIYLGALSVHIKRHQPPKI